MADGSRAKSSQRFAVAVVRGSGSQNGDTSAATVLYMLEGGERMLSPAVETRSVPSPLLDGRKSQKGAGK